MTQSTLIPVGLTIEHQFFSILMIYKLFFGNSYFISVIRLGICLDFLEVKNDKVLLDICKRINIFCQAYFAKRIAHKEGSLSSNFWNFDLTWSNKCFVNLLRYVRSVKLLLYRFLVSFLISFVFLLFLFNHCDLRMFESNLRGVR